MTAFMDGWSSNEQCVARQTSIRGRILEKDQLKIYPLPSDLVTALQSGEADAAFANEGFWTVDHRKVLDRFEDVTFHCQLNGNGMMTRKDSDFPAHWNAAFTTVKNNNQFKDFCKKANEEHDHKGTVNCLKV